MNNLRRIFASLLAFVVLSVSSQSAVASIPPIVSTLLDAAHAANSLIPSGAMVGNAEGLLQSCFGILGGPENLTKCVESLAKAGGASASQVKDLNDIQADCADIASPACIEAVAFSEAGTDILGEILPGADILINIIKMIDTGDIWGLISKVGVSVACIAAEVMTGGVDVCGAIKFVAEAVAAVVGAVGDAVAWIGDWLFGSDADPQAGLKAGMVQTLDKLTQHGELGLKARMAPSNRVEAEAYVESLKLQVIPADVLPFRYVSEPAWAVVKPPMVAFINNMWFVEVSGAPGAKKKLSITDREKFKQDQFLFWNGDAKSGNKDRFKSETLDCPALFKNFTHIDDYIAKPVLKPVQAQTTQQFCQEVVAKYAELRKVAYATDSKNDTESKEKKLLGMKCTKASAKDGGDLWNCQTWPAVYACETTEPKTQCRVDVALADAELIGRAAAIANKGMTVGQCVAQQSKAQCYRDAAAERCQAVLKAEPRRAASQAACAMQYDTAYRKLVEQTKAVAEAINAGNKSVFVKSGGVGGAKLDREMKTKPIAGAEGEFVAKMCEGLRNCVKVWDKDPLVIAYAGGKVSGVPSGTAVYFDSGKFMGPGCEVVSGTAPEVPQLCFGKLNSGEGPGIGAKYGDLKKPGELGAGNTTKDVRDSLGRDLGTGSKLGGKVGDVTNGGRTLDLGKGVVDPGKSPSGGNPGAYMKNNVGAGAALGGKVDLKAQVDTKQLVAPQLQQQLQQQQQQQTQQTMGAKAPSGFGGGGGAVTMQPQGQSTFKAPTSSQLGPGGLSSSNAATSAAGAGGMTAGMSSAERQAFALGCSASSREPKAYACSNARGLEACRAQMGRKPELGLNCTQK